MRSDRHPESNCPHRHAHPRRFFLAAAVLLALNGFVARADDRSLLEPTQKDPYVFIILDTSGSMHEEVSCTAVDIANGFCTQECDAGDCLPRMMGDDPDSKIYVAKQSIYTIMTSHPNINFGFGHFDQSQLAVSWKYWWYALDSSTPGFTLAGGTVYPAAGEQHIFGDQAWTCTTATPAPYSNVGCVSTQPAHLDNSWELERARRYPKLGDTNNAAAYSYFIAENSTSRTTPSYKVTFTPVAAQTMGAAQMMVSVAVAKCTNTSCSTSTALTGSPKTMKFNLANQTIYWETDLALNGTNIPDASGNGGNFYATRQINQQYSDPGSMKIEDNTETPTGSDSWSTSASCVTAGTCDMQQATTTDPSGRTPAVTFSIGDIIPLDWKSNQQTAIMQRMAPNLINGGSSCPAGTTPDFGIADYMADHPLSGESALRLKCTAQRPLAPDGGTPTGHVMMTFATWLADGATNWPTTAFTTNASSSSWIATASGSNGDPFFACKPAYVLLLTDGLASQDDGVTSNNPASPLPANYEGNHDKVCSTFYSWSSSESPQPGFACCAAEALRTITYGSAKTPYPVRTYVIGLGLTSTSASTYNNTLQCVADEGGTGNRHFFNGNKNTVSGQPAGYPAADPPPATFCTAANPCDGPGPLLPQSKQDIVNALLNVLNLIQSQTTAFASAAVPSLQSNIADESILTSFLPVNEPIWPGRVDAYINPVPTALEPVTLPDGTIVNQQLPNPKAACTSTLQTSCHLWNAGGGKDTANPPSANDTDVLLAQGLAGLDTAGNAPTKRRIYYAPQTPISGQSRFNFAMPALTSTAQLFDLETALGLCGYSYTFYPPTAETCQETSGLATTLCTAAPSTQSTPGCPTQTSTSPGISTTAQQAVTWTESIKTYLDPATNDTVQYLMGDIFHSNPQVLGQPSDPVLFDGNVDGTTCATCGYQSFAAQQQFRRKVVFFGSNDGELHALDAGTVGIGTEGDQPSWVFNNGTGSELFAFIPRTVMPTLNALAIGAQPPASGGSETFMVDGPPRLAEGFFDATGGTNPGWHSLVVGGLREGGRAYYALDVTQPDTLTSEPVIPGQPAANPLTVMIPNPGASSYLPNCINGGSGCGQVPWPTPLWEFTDSCKVVSTCSGSSCAMQPCDEDAAAPGKLQPDLGQTWSTPDTGRVRICDTTACTTFHDQWVVVFGGGMDPSNLNSQGNYLYMLDMATGAVIYKRPLNGSAPSEVAAVDTGLDGYIDTIYIGTTAGFLYKVDLTSPAPIVAQTGLGNRVSTTFWQPLEIFNTQGRQMYYPPAVFFDSTINEFGLAWGTGNRQDLWATDTTTGRFYVMIDNNITPATSGLPFTAANLVALTPDGAPVGSTVDYLDSTPGTGKQPGYYFELNPGERVLSEAFVLSGTLIFNTYEPAPATGAAGSSGSVVCIDGGNSRLFALLITNGNPLSPAVAASGSTPAVPGLASQGTVAAANQTGGSAPTDRYMILGETLALNITSAQNPVFNPPTSSPSGSGSGSSGTGSGSTGSSSTSAEFCDPSSPYIQNVILNIKKLMPQTCRFSNAMISVNLGQTSGLSQCMAAIPICIIEKNWKEF
jgi:hypothetical protein